MTLSWNEIKDRAIQFSQEWANTSREEADAKPFLDAFFNVFGITRRKVATFEHRIKKLDEGDGYIDMLWKGVILIEMKSRGKDLDKAYLQAKEYTNGLKQHELPKQILVSDFETFRLYDLDEDTIVEFKLADLIDNVQHFGYLLGYQKQIYQEQDPVNIKAAELMGKLHDNLKEIGYEGEALELYLVRLLFLLFADDTTIFAKQQLQLYIEQRTNQDGSDLASKLQELFQVLNTPTEKRFKNLDEQLAEFPYINGKLFEDNIPTASFDSKMRRTLLECCYLDWSKISPAIFGSMFQSVMNPVERRNLGAHYTSEENILKLIKPLFLDDLWAEFNKHKGNKSKIAEFHNKLSNLKIIDPACGCGNFLVITYRELRLLEIEILKNINTDGQRFINVEELIKLNIDMMYGIEYEEFPARIAEVAMWLIDHQMNMVVSHEFGQYFTRIPLQKSASIIHGDAMEVDWNSLIVSETIQIDARNTTVIVAEPELDYQINVKTKNLTIIDNRDKETKEINIPKADYFDYIIGNPPFIGSKLIKKHQREQIVKEFNNVRGSGVLDYVTGWYIKAAKYIQNTNAKVAFVSTNSIVQGEQTSILWKQMLNEYDIKIHFAHQTFKWSNEGRGVAAVYCVIVGFANYDTNNKVIFEYDDVKSEPNAIKAKNINPYLIDAENILIERRTKPLCDVPNMSFGNMPLDGGNLLLSDEEKIEFLKIEPKAEKYILPLISAREFINGQKRWCLWLVDAEPSKLRQMPEVMKRIEAVKNFRLSSKRQQTVNKALFPSLFGEIRDFGDEFIVIPRVSSERRAYIPMGFFDKNNIVSDTCLAVPNGTLYHFGILTSKMHMTWVKYTCGRLENRYRYSKDIVYNNYPWPIKITEKQRKLIEEKAQQVLDTRDKFPNNSLADLYDSLTMPPSLVKAHNELDRAVDLAYRSQPFTSESKRMEYLFRIYKKLNS